VLKNEAASPRRGYRERDSNKVRGGAGEEDASQNSFHENSSQSLRIRDVKRSRSALYVIYKGKGSYSSECFNKFSMPAFGRNSDLEIADIQNFG
jgi:hypothetical protein